VVAAYKNWYFPERN